jgi:two-component system CheB/CheR fusion protein
VRRRGGKNLPSGKERAVKSSRPAGKKTQAANGDRPEAGGAPASPTRFPVVGIGASAGGLEAFEQFFAKVPEEVGMAFIVVPHLDPSHASMMTELLRRATKLAVDEARDRMKVLPNRIYVIPPNKDMTISRGTLRLETPAKTRGFRLPIDSFFRSLAEDQGARAIGIILSGTGTDGSLGLRAIHEAGGIVMVQTPDSARYAGMPSSAAGTGLVDYVLPPEKMADQLLTTVRRPSQAVRLPVSREDRLRKILSLVRMQTGRDFSLYRKTTLNRRIEKRMTLLDLPDLSAYVDFLNRRPEEISLLAKDLLIGVTHFFRDPDAFAALKSVVCSYLKSLPRATVFRAWVPACGTGEEAYSIAMTVKECLEEEKLETKIQLFGTDIDPDAVSLARGGIYAHDLGGDISPARLRRFFVREEGGIRVRKEIRESIVFAVQDVTKDPPFTKLDLLSCRNLLIYFEPELQNKILPGFHYSLNPEGILFLGTSESIGRHAELFEVGDKKWKIFFAKKVHPAAAEETWGAHPWAQVRLPADRADEVPKPRDVDIGPLAEKTLLESFAPPSVIVDDKGEIIYLHGQTGKYLEPAQGRPRWNVFDMAREGFRFELRSAVHYALTKQRERRFENLPVKTNEREAVHLVVRPFLPTPETVGLAMITFEDASKPEKTEAGRKETKPRKNEDSRLREAERELAYTRESLQATVEELQAANEELTSTNEEMQSMNEELQSTNEELETSREELQSTNEELVTVNSELQAKIDSLSQTENDMKILLENTDIGIVFLDDRLMIKRFTSEVTKVFKLIPGDVGRPLHDIRSNIEFDGLEEDVKKVLANLRRLEKEVRTKDGEWYLMRIVPYRTAEVGLGGVVLTFTNISSLRRSRPEVAAARVGGSGKAVSAAKKGKKR